MEITDNVNRIFELQHQFENMQAIKSTDVKTRLEKIKKIERFLLDENNQNELAKALYSDLRKSKEETIGYEIVPVVVAISAIYKQLNAWMHDHRVGAPLGMAGLSSYIKYEPKGHVLIIAPWNYPFQLAISPLIHAIAAGNVIILKPSEISANTSAFIKKMLNSLFDEKEIAVVEGSVDVSTELLNKPFNHIFFTGSPAVWKIVMKAASQNLTSVTLELGGKSPVIVDDTATIKKAVEKIAWAKLLNNGQTCIAPDYLLIHESKKEEFVKEFALAVDRFYNTQGEGIEKSTAYSRIINLKNFQRIISILGDAVTRGAKIIYGGSSNETDLFIAPTLVEGVNNTMAIMQEELFGPLLPIKTYKELREVVTYIQTLPKALAIYIMSKSNKNIQFILDHTSAGGTAINELMVTTINPNLPFGGVNNSGIGKSNGKYGFIEFSNERGIVKRNWGTLKMLFPPYNKTIYKWLIKASRI